VGHATTRESVDPTETRFLAPCSLVTSEAFPLVREETAGFVFR
jgi:hypothetical protein